MLKRVNAWLDRQNLIVQVIVLGLFIFFIRTFFFGFYLVPSGSMESTMLVGERFYADKLTPYFRDFTRGEIIAFNAPLYKYSNNPVRHMWQKYVWGPDNWTKRIIGLPGEHLQGKIENGKPAVYVNGKKLDEPYLNQHPIMLLYDRSKPSHDGTDCDCVFLRSFEYGNEHKFYDFAHEDIVLMRDGGRYILQPGTPLEMDEFDITLGKDEYWVMGDNRLGSDDSRKWGPLKRDLIHGRIKFRIFSMNAKNDWILLDLLFHPISFWTRTRWSRCLNVVH